MDIRLLAVSEDSASGEPVWTEPVAAYLDRLDADRWAQITGRLELLKQLDGDGPLPDPPFVRVPRSPLVSLLVDYEGEVHQVVVGWEGGWILVHAFLDVDQAGRRREYALARRLWDQHLKGLEG